LCARVGETIAAAATRVEACVLPSCGHYPAEEAPDALLSALLPFLAGSEE
jgi:pimeloyl-ACP methyl ester carboxylesterase